MHGCSGVFRRDENVCLARFFANQKSVSRLVNVELASDQIGCRRQNVAIFPDPRDLARALEIAQHLAQTHAHAALPAERFRQFALVQRTIIGRPKKREYLFLNLTSVLSHHSETILSSYARCNAISIRGRIVQKAIIAGALAITMAAIVSFASGEAKMKITSSAFQEGGNIPSRFTCDGGDTSPPLQITEVPSGAKSLALVVDDPDAPSGLFTHWMVWNISPQNNTIAEGSTPKGVHGTNDFGKSGYGGPCPPSGTHRYYFKIFALDRELELPAGTKRSQLDAAMKGHVVAQGELMGRYSRKK